MTTTDTTFDFSTCTVAELALNFPKSINVLNKHNLDYCCHGKTSFIKVCENEDLNPHQIWQEILETNLNQGLENRMHFETWEPTLLIDFIIQHHHTYVRESIPQIQEMLNKVCDVHGSDSPYLLSVRENFNELADELLNHMPKEEVVLFPTIREILNAGSPDALEFVQAPLQVMESEHDRAGDLVKTLRNLTQNYTPPAHACPTFQFTYKLLKEFDEDLIQHIHLENNILFPKVKL